MPDTPLTAHSVCEVSLYFRITPCPACGDGPLEEQNPSGPADQTVSTIIRKDAICRSCDHKISVSFRMPVGDCQSSGDRAGAISGSDEPSEIIDLPQWLTLHSLLLNEASHETDKVVKRDAQIRAGECLTEALKFYDDPENDLPPRTACFCEASKHKLMDQPEIYSRQRLVNLRASLPKTTTRR